jgi:hypothetical protein
MNGEAVTVIVTVVGGRTLAANKLQRTYFASSIMESASPATVAITLINAT